MKMDPSFLSRNVNEGFSGGEKKRNEILQLAVLEPDVAILDEIDSGLDVDALKDVSSAVNGMRYAYTFPFVAARIVGCIVELIPSPNTYTSFACMVPTPVLEKSAQWINRSFFQPPASIVHTCT